MVNSRFKAVRPPVLVASFFTSPSITRSLSSWVITPLAYLLTMPKTENIFSESTSTAATPRA